MIFFSTQEPRHYDAIGFFLNCVIYFVAVDVSRRNWGNENAKYTYDINDRRYALYTAIYEKTNNFGNWYLLGFCIEISNDINLI